MSFGQKGAGWRGDRLQSLGHWMLKFPRTWVAELKGRRMHHGKAFSALIVLPECLAVLVCITLVWVSLLMPLEQEKRGAQLAAMATTSNLARAFDENADRIVSGIDQILLSARAAYAETKGPFDLNEWVSKRAKADKFAFFIGRVDANGMTQEATLKPAPPQINISDREHFRFHLDPSKDELFISKPVVGRATGKAALQFTRKLLNADGSFAGIVQVSMNADELSRFYEKLEIGNGYIMLVGLDGVVRARGPLANRPVGVTITNPETLQALHSSTQGTFSTQSKDGAHRIVSFRRLHDYPLVVMIGFDEADVLQKYWQSRKNTLITGGISTAVLLLLGLFWIDQRRRGIKSKRALRVTLDSISQGIIMLDAKGRMPVVNRRAVDLLNLPRGTLSLTSNRIEDHLALCIPPENPEWPNAPTAFDSARGDGKIIEVRRNPITTGGMVLTYTDVTDRKLAEARIRHLAQHDTLTGLPNRLLMHERLHAAVEHAARTGTTFAVLCLDLDGFKNVNDTMGHEAGDLLLVHFAERLRMIARPTDTISRTGGDEFAIVQVGGIQPGAAETLAERLLEAAAKPMNVDSYRFNVATSIGIARYPADGGDSKTLLRNADIAMYRAKADGRGIYRFYDAGMDTFLQERRLLEHDLRQALEQDRLDVYLQPQFSCDTLEITGFEVLARWNDPVRGFVPPSVFISVAEECGLIVKLGRTVLERACTLAATWYPQVRIAVNVSPIQFRDGALPDLVANVLARTGLPAHLLEIEVTEGVLISNEQQALGTLRAIKALGVRVALDDFGTGYSSLSYLRRFPFDKIKIDKSFVQAQQNDAGTQAIMEALLTMSSRLNLEVTAEGVETEEQLIMLQRQGCTEIQGFLLGCPMPSDDVPAFLRMAQFPATSWRAAHGHSPAGVVAADQVT